MTSNETYNISLVVASKSILLVEILDCVSLHVNQNLCKTCLLPDDSDIVIGRPLLG